MKMFTLIPDNRKSFYGKCKVIEDNDVATLFSYDRNIMSVDLNTGKVTTTMYFNHSQTTRRHQKAFMKMYDIDPNTLQKKD